MCRSVKKTEPHPVTHHELQLTVMVIVVAFGVLLCLEKTLVDLHQESVTVAQENIHHLSLSSPGSMGK